MGSIITLGIDKYDLDFGKNNNFKNHSILYKKHDIRKEYYYYADNYKEKKDAFSKKLIEIKDTLELLGYTLKSIRKEFNDYCSRYREYYSDEALIEYDDFHDIIKNIEPENTIFSGDDKRFNNFDFFKHLEYCIRKKFEIDDNRYMDEEFYMNIDPYIILRILLENNKNHNRSVIWRYSDIIESGWVNEDVLFENIDRKNRFLIVTEGSSDTNIIKKSFHLLNLEIEEFFYFVDMKENYPFTGSGNLYNFVKGLSRINIMNKILIIFDNDTEGSEKFFKCKREIKLPPNIRVAKLPSLEDFKRFNTIGTYGKRRQNVNDKAISIECFLDLNYKNNKDIIIRWKNYNKKLDAYQGVLENKNKYISTFLKIRSIKTHYNFEKLKLLNRFIIEECERLNEDCKFHYI